MAPIADPVARDALRRYLWQRWRALFCLRLPAIYRPTHE